MALESGNLQKVTVIKDSGKIIARMDKESLSIKIAHIKDNFLIFWNMAKVSNSLSMEIHMLVNI